jgi:hypothetical protein
MTCGRWSLRAFNSRRTSPGPVVDRHWSRWRARLTASRTSRFHPKPILAIGARGEVRNAQRFRLRLRGLRRPRAGCHRHLTSVRQFGTPTLVVTVARFRRGGLGLSELLRSRRDLSSPNRWIDDAILVCCAGRPSPGAWRRRCVPRPASSTGQLLAASASPILQVVRSRHADSSSW